MKKMNGIKSFSILLLLMAGACVGSAVAQKSGERKEKGKEKMNDSNTPLHLLQPDYRTGYGVLKREEVKRDMDRVFGYLDRVTPACVEDKRNGRKIKEYKQIDGNSQLRRGDFRLAAYEWGVTYAGMLRAAEVTGDERYLDYVSQRIGLLAEVAPYFKQVAATGIGIDPQMRQILFPHALDDAGAVCAAMIKWQTARPAPGVGALIDNYMDFIVHKEYRLSDGTFARNRPQANTLWLDDMFMSVPAIVNMGRLTGDTSYYGEAVRQIVGFSKRMFVSEKGLYRHGWVEGMDFHPAFHWGRANGWAILTLTEVLDVLPADFPGRDRVMEQYQAHIRGLAALQGGDGFWHQLLDRMDSYPETSATAIYTYCLAHGINQGWLDAMAFGPVAVLGWHAVASQINGEGQVEGTCVGTGMGFDPAFYYYRPVNVYAAHGYGPVVWAGAEMIRLLDLQHPKMNDSAVQFYKEEQKTDKPIFSVEDVTNIK